MKFLTMAWNGIEAVTFMVQWNINYKIGYINTTIKWSNNLHNHISHINEIIIISLNSIL